MTDRRISNHFWSIDVSKGSKWQHLELPDTIISLGSPSVTIWNLANAVMPSGIEGTKKEGHTGEKVGVMVKIL